jgi:hypothetical protein
MDKPDRDKPNREIPWLPVLAVGIILLSVCIPWYGIVLMRASRKESLFQLNVSTLVRPHAPEEAAIMVARRHERRDGGPYLARRDSEAQGLGPEMVRYVVSRDDIDIARVTLKPFQDLGWQEFGYANLVCCPDSRPGN